MATTFIVQNGDITLSQITGRPNMVGNVIVENFVQADPAQSRSKVRQDIARSLSLVRVRAGTTANIQSIIGTVPQFGASAVSLLVSRQIRDMISAIIREQSLRPSVRPTNEKIRAISKLQVFLDKQAGNNTSFRFRLGLRTQDDSIFELTGTAG